MGSIGISRIAFGLVLGRDLLETNDVDAPRACAKLTEPLRGTIEALQLDSLCAAVNALHFEVAVRKLNEIEKQYCVSQMQEGAS